VNDKCPFYEDFGMNRTDTSLFSKGSVFNLLAPAEGG
jgi:hypothetical protein